MHLIRKETFRAWVICDHGPIDRLMNLENVGREGGANALGAPLNKKEIE